MRFPRRVLHCVLAVLCCAASFAADDKADWDEAAPGFFASKLERKPAGPLPLALSEPAAKFAAYLDEIRASGSAPKYVNPIEAAEEAQRKAREERQRLEAEEKRALEEALKKLTPLQRAEYEKRKNSGETDLEALIGVGAVTAPGDGAGWGGGTGTGTFGSRNGGSRRFMVMKHGGSAAPGVTAGGVKDIGTARRCINEGIIPNSKLFYAEGLISEHSIALGDSPREKGLLYPSASFAYLRRYGHTEPEALVQLGFGANLPGDKFERPALNLSIVIDCSGSMRGDRIVAAQAALNKIIAQLTERDRVSLVCFDTTAWVALSSSVATETLRGEAHAAIAKNIVARGGTDIGIGLKAGLEQVAAHMNDGGRQHRVILITDARPNAGATQPHEFLPMLQAAASREIGLSLFCVGIDVGADLAATLAQTPLANSHYLEDAAKLEKVFDAEFDFVVTPVATDVEIKIHPQHGARITDATGVPDFKRTPGGTADAVSLKIPTLFFSAREGGGATIVALKLPADFQFGRALADVSLSFRTTGQFEGAAHTYAQTLRLAPPATTPFNAERAFYSHDGVRKATLLAELISAYKTACALPLRADEADVFWADAAARSADAATPVAHGPRAAPLTATAVSGSVDVPAAPPAIDPRAERSAATFSRFLDWFAAQSSGLPELETELRLAEKLEALLYKPVNKPHPPARTISAATPARVPAPPLDF